jgi:catechol 2,3-dioxygenase-like lactoylglutathione lyase family enzyme
MIDHVSIAVRDLAASARFYEQLLGVFGFTKLRDLSASVGFGREYPEFWLNHRPCMIPDPESGAHVSLRAKDRETVERFFAEAMRLGATSDLAPHVRRETYYAAFIRDPDGNRVEAVTFLPDEK